MAIPSGPAEIAIAGLVRGGRVVGLTKGQFSMLDLLRAVLDMTGPADVRLSTWTAGIRDVEGARLLLDSGRMTSLRLYVDRSFPSRQPAYCAAVQRTFGDAAIRMSRIHAKIATVHGGGWAVAIRGSMNLNKNPRIEQFDIDDSPEIAAFYGAHFNELDATTPPGVDVNTAQVDAVFDRLLRGINPMEAPARDALTLRGVPMESRSAFARWLRAQMNANRRLGKPCTVAGIAGKVGCKASQIGALLSGRAELDTIAEDAAFAVL
jgi:hypothetical protein